MPNQRKRKHNEEQVQCIHCGQLHSKRDERRHRKWALAELQYQQDYLGASASQTINVNPPVPDIDPLPGHNDPQKQVTRSELLQRRHRRLQPDDFDENWYLQDQDPGAEGIDLFGRTNPNGIDWEQLPEEALDDPFAGLTPEEILSLGFARATSQISYDSLSERDHYILDSFNFRVTSRISSRDFGNLKYAFPGRLDDMPSLYETQTRVAALSGLTPRLIDCCRNSCICYTDQYANLQSCPSCKAPRLYANGKPAKQFSYLPFTPRLIAMLNGSMRKKMEYRYEFDLKDHKGYSLDIFNGSHYRNLKERPIPSTRTRGRKYFESPTDVALALASDGFCPFRNRKQSCWPICLYNLNLPPEERFHLENTICVGVIPGPKSVKDISSFLFPLVEELLDLLHGVAYYDKHTDSMEILHAFLILVFGDMPAIAKLMEMKGHNGKCPCRACEILGVRIPNSNNPVHYIPLKCPSSVDRSRPVYDPLNLPLRTHDRFMAQANEVINASTNAQEDELSTRYGIKRIPLLSVLPTIKFPTSFPLDFMHLIWENLIPNLLKLWTGDFKGLDEGTGSYELGKSVFEAICEAVISSGDTYPYSFGCRVPDPSKDRSYFSAECCQAYYIHFIDLVKLLQICLQFELSAGNIQGLRTGFANWVTRYEKLYFQHKAYRLPTCTSSVHELDLTPEIGGLYSKLMACLVTRFDKNSDVVKNYIPNSARQWRKVLRTGGGDLMVARGVSPLGHGYRDNSFVRYHLLVDILAHRPNANPIFQPRMFYGQLLHIFAIDFPEAEELGTDKPETVLFAAIQECKVTHVDKRIGTPYYTNMGPTEVVDFESVKCVVGRVRDERGFWGIIDRSGPLAQAEFRGDEPLDGDEGNE
ncbi:transposase family Tnp2 protein, partial [Rhizoctonia solani AG-3 Rhs1AP]